MLRLKAGNLLLLSDVITWYLIHRLTRSFLFVPAYEAIFYRQISADYFAFFFN